MTEDEIVKELIAFCEKEGFGYWTWNEYYDAVIAFCSHFYQLGKG